MQDPAAPSEIQWLAQDINEYDRAIRANTASFAVLGDTTDPDRHNYHELVVDQFIRAYHHAIGLHALIEQRLAVPANAVSRAFLEAVINLGYLIHCKEPVEAAGILRAYSCIKETKLFGTDEAVVRDRQSILKRMPERVVRIAQHRVKKQEHWTGQSLKRTAATAGVHGLDIHSYLSEDAHARIVGHLVRVSSTEEGKGVLTLGPEMSETTAESMANFTRRLLNSAFGAMWTVLNAPPLTISSPDAHAWAGSDATTDGAA